ncbi:3-hydroxybutyryl-CoA dehydrogenase [Aquisalimonas asiatica]|uniref:3-hydroxybutyryl-CoA dehydrogenase n=1 Tax=Aquisalimonas asiatica TaxID=406100 RepID=A0A1H8UL06_9GAMM|nr:3-hydroxybutyryl-CoA dehydrogenase [Aquisalimonas asiatica]SEP03766.1 3-hydroxybutyryl-CoA dehydrogenase [Aquisalimonas asiatica]
MSVKTVGVIGAGTMGNGIAQAFAVSGFSVKMSDIGQEQVDRGRKAIEKSLDRLVSKDKLSVADHGAALGRVEGVVGLDGLADCDFIVEAATEREELKLDIFRKLSDLVSAETVLASNTSSISLTRIAAATANPERVIGMHFFNPVPVMKLVEVVRALQTSDAVFEQVESLTRQLGKEPVAVKDSPGFAVNRILVPMINEACFACAEGIAAPEDIDKVMQMGANHPMGPLALADLIGLDTCLEVMKVLHSALGDPKYRPSPLLQQMVDAGYLGRKVGRGFYVYD